MLVSVGPNLAREGTVAASEIFINQITPRETSEVESY